ncbi:hypothetical protein [Nocardioides daeguensis]|uniref:SnoaL-like domain-containing protein n=1 Tax=Nocardioides daeguensis TaxID=908359 RepID=A0ABP6V7C5_9ACTN|nr:hypothetical protein [Nocardioides daeguensis]MBV6726499.1 hypothetical protein [Nocardioides daeguensis]MCR1772342.1 hypothetical protein [Nocardioides daeguensis]
MADFETTYRAHVGKVASGDLKGALADMAPGAVPAVFEGVTVPGGDVSGVEVVATRVDGDRATGEAVYATPAGPIGLRSGWALVEGAWLADSLENFDA